MPKLRVDQYLCLLLISVALLLMPSQAVSNLVVKPRISQPIALVPATNIPIFVSDDDRSADQVKSEFVATLSAQAIYVVDVPSAAVLLTKLPEEPRYPASTTKLMTALVARDSYPLDTFLTVTSEASTAGSVIGLEPGERLPLRDLLSAMLIQSGNDAAQVIADNYPGGETAFMQAMNQKATALHLNNSWFSNATGIDTGGHRSTARDLALLAREVMKDPLLSEIVGTRSETISDELQLRFHQLRNTNALLGSELGVIGIKTGTTEEAGEVLIAQFRDQGREVMIVVMGSQDRYADTRRIWQWIQDHYIWNDPNSGTLNKTST